MSSKKSAKSNKLPTVVDGVDVASLTRGELVSLVLRLKQENSKEKEQRSCAHVELDKLSALCEQIKSELEVAREDLKSKDRILEDATLAKDKEMSLLKRQIKTLQERKGTTIENRIQSLREQFDDDIYKTKKEFADQTKNLIQNLKQQFHEDITKAKSEFTGEAKQLDLRLGQSIDNLRQEMRIVDYETDIDVLI